MVTIPTIDIIQHDLSGEVADLEGDRQLIDCIELVKKISGEFLNIQNLFDRRTPAAQPRSGGVHS